MPLTQLAPPYPIFTDKNGDPLDAGYLYFGELNQNPETNPVQVYWDNMLTQPAAQPIRTINGYPSRNGAPALIYADDYFSVTVRNKRNELVTYSPAGFGVIPFAPVTFATSDFAVKDVATLLADVAYTYSAGVPNTIQVTAGDILRTLAEGFAYEVAASGATDQHVTTAGGVKLYVLATDFCYPEQFGPVGTEANDTAAFTAMTAFLRAKAASATFALPAVQLAARQYELSAPIDWTDFIGLRVEGVSREETNIVIKAPSGGPAIDLTGTGRTTFRDFRVTGDAVDVPSCIFLQARSTTNPDGAGEHLWERVYATGSFSVAGVVNCSHEISRWADLRIRATGGGSIAGLYIAKRPNLLQALGVDSPNRTISSIYSCTNFTYEGLIISGTSSETAMVPVVIEDGVGIASFRDVWVAGYADKGMYFKGNSSEGSSSFQIDFDRFVIEQPITNIYGIWADTTKTWARININGLGNTASTGVTPEDTIKWTGASGGFQDCVWNDIVINSNAAGSFGFNLRTFSGGSISNISKTSATLTFVTLNDSDIELSTSGQEVVFSVSNGTTIRYTNDDVKAGIFDRNMRRYANWTSLNVTSDATPSVKNGNMFSMVTTAASNSDVTDFDDGADGQVIVIRNSSFGKTVTIKNSAGTLETASGSDLVLAYKKIASFALFGAVWGQIS